MFFRLNSLELGLILFGIVLGTTMLGVFLGSRLRRHVDALREPFGVLQAALLGLVALILAFGLTMAVGRYDSRRAATVDDANAIGTTYLRAQTLREPIRTRSLRDLELYTDASIRLSNAVPGSGAAAAAIADENDLQRSLWRLAGEALAGSPRERPAPLRRLAQPDDRHADGPVSALANRVPTAVLVIEIVGAAIGLGLLAMYLAILSRGVATVVLAASFVSVLLLITFDLDRPTRGLVTVPDTPLVSLRASMARPPAAQGPQGPLEPGPRSARSSLRSTAGGGSARARPRAAPARRSPSRRHRRAAPGRGSS